MPAPPPRYVGQALTDRRAQALLTGRAVFADDVRLDRPLHLAFMRSVLADATLEAVDTSQAEYLQGVVAVHVGRDVADLGRLSVNPVLPVTGPLEYPLLAGQAVYAVGQPVAAVLAESPFIAQDAVECVYAQYGDPPAGEAHGPSAFQHWQTGDVAACFDRADQVVECRVRHPRLAPSPMEPRTIAVEYEPTADTVRVWHSTQTPHRSRSELAAILGIDAQRIHVVATSVGGAFGMKASLYPEEVFAVWAAFRHRRSVKWTASRSEDFLAATHGRGVHTHGRLAIDRHGRFLALQARTDAPVGHWLPNSGLVTAWNSGRILPGGYRIEALDIQARATPAHRAPTGIYRGAGRPEANCLIERLVDLAARATGLDPFAIRERNLLGADELPHETATGNVLDSGDYAGALRLLRERGGYDELLRRRDACRAQGGLYGVGLGFYVEPSGNGWESAEVTWQADDSVDVASGSSSQGHGRETAFAQIAADALGITIERVAVRCADTARCPAGIGALASRSTAIGGSAVLEACRELVARRARGESLPLTAAVRYENTGQAWGYGAYLVAVRIDVDTGQLTIERASCVDDTGLVVNPAQVDGQVRGGFAQGLGEATMEQVVYDENDQLLTGSFMDYAMPRAADIPALDIHKMHTPSPFNTLGAKGVGEAGTIGAPAAILNAALDALAGLGIAHLDMPLTPDKLWHAIHAPPPNEGEP
ncbi:MAG: xanthine dehydrogenase family protein molybdopterin-binding subunit [Burkholderiaceae bacterium]